MRKSLGFIGSGRMAKILLQGFNYRNVKFKKIMVSDVNSNMLDRTKTDFPFIETAGASVAASQDIVFLALEQNAVMDTISLLRDDFDDDAIVVSLAPNITFDKLILKLSHVTKMVRMIPDPTAYIGKGYIPVSFSPGFPASDKDDVLELFGNIGRAFEVPEEKLENYAVMSAMIQSYFWDQWKELIDVGQEMGLTEQESIDFVHESIHSAFHMRYKSGLTSDQIVDVMPVNPVEEEGSELREGYRSRLIKLYRRVKPEILETATAPRLR